jgi:hypothetical protein
MKVHVGGNVFDCGDYESAKRLAGYFREELEARFTCVRCQKMVALPLREIERPGPTCTIFDASAPDAKLDDWWHFIDAGPGWPHTGWTCDACWAHWLEVVIRYPDE